MPNVIILGGGIAGLLAARVLRQFRPLVVEAAPKLGGNYAAGGLKYIRQTKAFTNLLAELNIDWKPHQPRGKLYLDGEIHDHPDYLRSVNHGRREHIQLAHWVKTRGFNAGVPRNDCMNDPMGNGADVAMDCDHQQLLSRLLPVESACLTDARVVKISERDVTFDHAVVGASGYNGPSRITKVIPYDFLVPTIPLGILAKLAPWAKLPEAVARPLSIVDVHIALAGNSPDPKWDYMYTPTLPNISRIVWKSVGIFQLEIPGIWTQLYPDISEGKRLLALEVSKVLGLTIGQPRKPGNIHSVSDARVIPGHLEPLATLPSWPDNWHPLGRFTEWEPRATAERIYSRALCIAAEITARA